MNKKSCVGASFTQCLNCISIFLRMQEEIPWRFLVAPQDDDFLWFVNIAIV
ncbi:MAG: hypothetical protein F6K39_27650 [Okeania sp. SIO3B3]|nr:hypothetical protein [Okeania sp. SIO3B3]